MPLAETTREDVGRHLEKVHLHSTHAPKPFPVHSSSRAHTSTTSECRSMALETVDPGVSLVVVERYARGHRGVVGGGVEIIGVQEGTERLGCGTADRRLPGSGDAHDHDAGEVRLTA